MSTEITPDQDGSEIQLFQHSRRPQWGRAVVVSERPEAHTLQFEDGGLRKINADWLHLIEPVEALPSEAAMVARDLATRYREALADKHTNKTRDRSPAMSFGEQIRVLRHLYPGAFKGKSWQQDVRGAGAAKLGKRHRNPAIELAQQRLSKEALTQTLAEQGASAVHSTLVDVLSKTDMVSPSKEVAPLDDMPEAHHAELAEALIEVLHGDGELEERMRRWIIAMEAGGSVHATWNLVTAPLALVHPTEHVLVRWQILHLQACEVQPASWLRRGPTPGDYASALSIVLKTRERLLAEGLAPHDLLDVVDFSWRTLRPKGQRTCENLPLIWPARSPSALDEARHVLVVFNGTCR